MKIKKKEKEIYFLFIIPTLNSYKKLPKLIDSFMNQEYQKCKILFVDGKSTNKHKKFIKEYCKSDSRFKIIEEKGNSQGIYKAMNLGLKFIKKNYWTFFIGSDDYLFSSESLKKLAYNIKNNNDKNLSLIISNGNIISTKTKRVIRKNIVPKKNLINRKIFSQLLFRGYVPAHQTVCFSSSILKLIPPYSEKYILASDLDMFLRLSYSKYLNKILFLNITCFNIEAGGVSSKLTLKRFEEVTRIYLKYYGLNFLIPIFFRYFRKIISILINFKF